MLGRLGFPELVIIVFIIIMIFGANRLPEIGRGIGKGIRNFKDASREGAKRHIHPAAVVGAQERAILLVRGAYRPPERRARGHEAGAPHPAGLLRRLSRQGGGGNPGAGPALPLR